MKINIKDIIRNTSNLIHWQFRKRSYENEFQEIYFDALNALEQDSYFIYKNFLSKSQIQELKQTLQGHRKKNRSIEKNSIYFRSRTNVSLDSDFLNILTKNDFIKKILYYFFQIPTKIERCTYEFKNGLSDKEKNDDKGEHCFHIDRGYGVLKFCLFLEDINEKNGPFCIIPGSHKWSKSFKSTFHRFFSTFYKTTKHLSDEETQKYIDINLQKTLTGKAGDLLVVNTGAFHKGTSLGKNTIREVCWLYINYPNFLSMIKNKLYFKNKK